MKNKNIDEIEKQFRKDFYVGMAFAVGGVIALLIALNLFCH